MTGRWRVFLVRRQRGPKRPIPEDQKDEKYFERRSRNNEAAKKSRSMKRQREAEVEKETKELERERSYLDAQIAHLEKEVEDLSRHATEKKKQYI